MLIPLFPLRHFIGNLGFSFTRKLSVLLQMEDVRRFVFYYDISWLVIVRLAKALSSYPLKDFLVRQALS